MLTVGADDEIKPAWRSVFKRNFDAVAVLPYFFDAVTEYGFEMAVYFAVD